MLTLSKAIAAASLFMGKEEARPHLHYVTLIPRADFLLVSATDGTSAFFGRVDLPDGFGADAMLLAATTAKRAKPSSSCYIQGKELVLDDSTSPLKSDRDEFNFPDVMRIIPRNLSKQTQQGEKNYLIAPCIGEKINKANKIITGGKSTLPDFVPNGGSPWLARINEDAFVVAMPYRSISETVPVAGLYEELTEHSNTKE